MAKGKYHEWLTPEGLIKIEGWARNGLTNEQIAHNCGITRETLNQWRNKYSAISDALKKGKEVVDIQVENALLQRALGYDYEEREEFIEDTDGARKKRVRVLKKKALPDVAAQIFWLRNRRRGTWSNNPEGTHAENTGENDNLFEAIKTAVKKNEV
jgi:transcriptional regulator with XRE-family HTH domain